ncbi:MAG TPA: PqqD family protein [Bryobacteraceae bacterium]|nr:PqqD family protein [Bryobacteraceae bacterium]
MFVGLGRALRKRAAREFEAPRKAGITISTEVRMAVAGDHVGFLHIGNGRVFRSNLTGGRVWRGLSDDQDLCVIAARLSADYDVPQARVQEDIEKFVTDLEKQGMLTRR